MELWAIICLFFGFYSMLTLFEERHKAKFVLNEVYNSPAEFDFLYCIQIESMFERKRERLAFKRRAWTLEQLRNASFEIIRRTVNRKQGYFKLKKIISDADKTNSYAFFYFRFCLLLRQVYDMITVRNHLPWKGTSCFMVTKEEPFIFLNYCIDTEHYNQLKVINLPHPYSNCLNTIDGRRPYSKFKCTNDCLRTLNRSLLFYYDPTDTGGVDTKPEIGLDLKNEKYCLQKCSRDDCALYIIAALHHRPSSKIIRAVALTSRLEFLFQLISLINLLTGMTVLKECFVFTRLLFSDYHKIRIIRKICKKLKKFQKEIEIAIIIACLLWTLAVYYKMISAFLERREHPLVKETINFDIATNSFSLVICSKLKGNQYDDFLFNSDAYNKSSYLREKDFTFKELEDWTQNELNRTLQDIYIDYGSKREEVSWKTSPKVYFFFFVDAYFRCYRIDISITQQKIQSLIMISKLVVRFKHTEVLLFLLPENQVFTSKSYSFNSMMDIVKRQENKLNQYEKGECTDYRALSEGCLDKQSCIDKCNVKIFLQRHKSITTGFLLDKTYISNTSARFNFTIDSDIRKECDIKYPLEECYKTVFDSDTQRRSTEAQLVRLNKVLKVDLSIDSITTTEENANVLKLVFDLLNFQAIVFGLNVKGIFFFLYCVLTKGRDLKKFRLFKYPVYLFCLSGLVFHLKFIYSKILNGELTYSQYYQESKEFRIPELIFCVQFNEASNDLNHKQTGKHLDQLTKNITLNRMFDKIKYLNEFNRFKTLRPDFKNSKDLKFKTFFFLSRKCFRLSIEISYIQQQFYFTENDGAVSILMNKQFLKEVHLVYFISKIKDTMHFSKLVVFAFNRTANERRTFQIRQRVSEVVYNDRFSVLKNPMSLFLERNTIKDVTRYLVNLKRGFLKLGYETRQLPIADDNFGFEIDESLFRQFFSQVQNVSDNQNGNHNFNYERHYISNQVAETTGELNTFGDLEFVPIFFKEVFEITNSDSYTSLVLHCLNALSIWFAKIILNLSPLERPYLVTKTMFGFFFKCLLTLERRLYRYYNNNRI